MSWNSGYSKIDGVRKEKERLTAVSPSINNQFITHQVYPHSCLNFLDSSFLLMAKRLASDKEEEGGKG